MDAGHFVEEQTGEIAKHVKGNAIVALSGGVDSTVAAALVSRAIGDRLLAVYVDTGLMRKGETEKLTSVFERLHLNFRVVRASELFFESLGGVEDAEAKRLAIGRKFIQIFEEEAGAFQAEYLVQGTIAPDWIESGGTLRDRIKSHHNVAGLPPEMKLKLVEPLRDLYKDEVRAVARFLKIPVAERQPFPGPGLAVRIIGRVTPEDVAIEREACSIVEEEIEAALEAGKIGQLPWQYFSVLIPVRSVGVQGDVRVHGRTIVVRAVMSKDAMTARFSDLPHDVLENISTKITNRLGASITRVVYDITNKPPATIEWE